MGFYGSRLKVVSEWSRGLATSVGPPLTIVLIVYYGGWPRKFADVPRDLVNLPNDRLRFFPGPNVAAIRTFIIDRVNGRGQMHRDNER